MYFINLSPLPRSLTDSIILQHAPPVRDLTTLDELRWRWTTNGAFAVASAYKALMIAGKVFSPCKGIWKLKVLPTVRLFLYFLTSDRLLTQYQLFRRGIVISPKCVMCEGEVMETAEHLFFNCHYTKAFWASLCSGSNIHPPSFMVSVRESVCRLLSHDATRSTGTVLLVTGFWMLWLERNNRVFRSARRTIRNLTDSVRVQEATFMEHC